MNHININEFKNIDFHAMNILSSPQQNMNDYRNKLIAFIE